LITLLNAGMFGTMMEQESAKLPEGKFDKEVEI
jgi:hypothetical protein